MVSHILVPVDDSDPSDAAFEFALEEYPDAQITAIHVINPQDFYAGSAIEGAMVTTEDMMENSERRAKRILGEAEKRAAERDVEIETDYVIGSVARSILDYVDEHEVDYVVIGSHGRTGASRILLGSVAEKVTRRSPVPVTVVR